MMSRPAIFPGNEAGSAMPAASWSVATWIIVAGMWWIMMIAVLGSIVFLGRNIYCQQICPFMVVQDLAQKISGVKMKIDSRFQKRVQVRF